MLLYLCVKMRKHKLHREIAVQEEKGFGPREPWNGKKP